MIQTIQQADDWTGVEEEERMEGRGNRVRWGRDLRATVNSWAALGATE